MKNNNQLYSDQMYSQYLSSKMDDSDNNMISDENGSIIVEASYVIPLFLMFCISFLMLFNVIYAQAKINTALVTASEDLSQFGYVYNYLSHNKKAELLTAITDLIVTFTNFPHGKDSTTQTLYDNIGIEDFESSAKQSNRSGDESYFSYPTYLSAYPVRNNSMGMVINMCIMKMCIVEPDVKDEYLGVSEYGRDATYARIFFENHFNNLDNGVWDFHFKDVAENVDASLSSLGVTKKSDPVLGRESALGGLDFSGSEIYKLTDTENRIRSTSVVPIWHASAPLYQSTMYANWINEAAYDPRVFDEVDGVGQVVDGEPEDWAPGGGGEGPVVHKPFSGYFTQMGTFDLSKTGYDTEAMAFAHFEEACMNNINNYFFQNGWDEAKQDYVDAFGNSSRIYMSVDLNVGTSKERTVDGGLTGDDKGWASKSRYCAFKGAPTYTPVTKYLNRSLIKLRVTYEMTPANYFGIKMKFNMANEIVSEGWKPWTVEPYTESLNIADAYMDPNLPPPPPPSISPFPDQRCNGAAPTDCVAVHANVMKIAYYFKHQNDIHIGDTYNEAQAHSWRNIINASFTVDTGLHIETNHILTKAERDVVVDYANQYAKRPYNESTDGDTYGDGFGFINNKFDDTKGGASLGENQCYEKITAAGQSWDDNANPDAKFQFKYVKFLTGNFNEVMTFELSFDKRTHFANNTSAEVKKWYGNFFTDPPTCPAV
ncbi:MAG: hypothetical protein LBN03_00360 [Bifidobacteriaceae bacterium]|jgi:hypothetical protein|nr:hypothetical protein [Bifidobacteriaceae bacterium]